MRALGAGRDVGEGVAVLVDVDRDRRAALQLGPVRVAGGERLLAVLERHLRQELERLARASSTRSRRPGAAGRSRRGRPRRARGRARRRRRASASAARSRAARPPRRGGPCRRGRRARPSTRSAGLCAPQPEQLVDRDAGELPLQVVERRVERGAGRVLAGRQRRPRSRRAPRGRRRGRSLRARRAPIRRSGRSARSARPRRTRCAPSCRTSTWTTSATSCEEREIVNVSASANARDPGGDLHRASLVEMSSDRRRRIDLSHTIEDGMSTYPGLPGPIVCDYLSREASRRVYAPGYRVPDRRRDPVLEHRNVRRQPVPPLSRRDRHVAVAARPPRRPRRGRRRPSRARARARARGVRRDRGRRESGARADGLASPLAARPSTAPAATRSSPARRQSTCGTPAPRSSGSTR